MAIGDIHGGLRALTQVLGKVKVSPDDILIFLGDYVDGWSESAQTIKWLIELSKNQECIFIKGNHDIYGAKNGCALEMMQTMNGFFMVGRQR